MGANAISSASPTLHTNPNIKDIYIYTHQFVTLAHCLKLHHVSSSANLIGGEENPCNQPHICDSVRLGNADRN